jgi:hypothetical protein
MENQKLMEVVADISFIAGEMEYFSGNSRADVSNFIFWAKQFQQHHAKTDWDEVDYILEIQEFAIKKIQSN